MFKPLDVFNGGQMNGITAFIMESDCNRNKVMTYKGILTLGEALNVLGLDQKDFTEFDWNEIVRYF